MEIGQLRHLVEIQEQTPATPPNPLMEAGLQRECVASIEPVQGREVERAKAIYSETSHKIVIRYNEDITTANRILFGERVFNLVL